MIVVSERGISRTVADADGYAGRQWGANVESCVGRSDGDGY